MELPAYRVRDIQLLFVFLAITLIIFIIHDSGSIVYNLTAYFDDNQNNAEEPVNNIIYNLYRTDLHIDDWQPVITNVSYVYSAYLNSKSELNTSSIRIIATLRDKECENSKLMPTLYCLIWIWGSHHSPRVIMSPVNKMTNMGGVRRYSSMEFGCQFMVDMSQLKNATISVMTEDEAFSASVNDTVAAMFVTSHNIMKLHYNIAPRSPEISITRQNVAKKYSSSEELCYNVPTTVMATFTVCLWQPLFLLRYDPEWFVEWMEYNILFGADLIQIYSYDIPKTLYTYIGYYQRLGVLYLLPWTLPKIADNTKYNRRLQFAMILECHLRYQYKSKYIVAEDLDELIVPRSPHHMSWSAMIQNSNCSSHSMTYGVRNLVFKIVTHKTNRLLTFDNIKRAPLVYPFFSRSKYIAKTGVKQMKIHSTDDRHNICILDIDLSALHHYRFVDGLYNESDAIFDKSILVYRDSIKPKVDQVTAKINHLNLANKIN